MSNIIKYVYAHKEIYSNYGIKLHDFDIELAHFLVRNTGVREPAVLALFWYLSLLQREGHAAVDISEILGENLLELFANNERRVSGESGIVGSSEKFPSDYDFKYDHLKVLEESGILLNLGNSEETDRSSLLVLDNNWLYFRRFYGYERDIAEILRRKSVSIPVENPNEKDEYAGGGTSGIMSKSSQNVNFDKSQNIDPIQKQAVETGINRDLCIITGGPGTGKTYTVLLLLKELYKRNPNLLVALCAPTGKAAARMIESVIANMESLQLDEEVRSKLPEKAFTIHRLLGWNPTRGTSKYKRDNPLPYDVVILDEASMVDMALMARLLRALRSDTKLVLLGDQNQLAAVEAGSVFADIATMPNVIRLQKSWRFREDSTIGKLAALVNGGQADASFDILLKSKSLSGPSEKSDKTSTYLVNELKNHLHTRISSQHARILECFRDVTKTSKNPDEIDELSTLSVKKALDILKKFQVLSAHRRGQYGAEVLNAFLDRRFSANTWYAGRPVMVHANDYELGLFNGDVGITVEINGNLVVAFNTMDSDGALKWVSPTRLKGVSSAWVLTVHKSQGSEFDDILLILPERKTEVLSRELIYTALTRARNHVHVWTREEVWKAGVLSKIERKSGLGARIKGFEE